MPKTLTADNCCSKWSRLCEDWHWRAGGYFWISRWRKCFLRSNTGLVNPCLSLPLLNGKLDILSYLLEQGPKKNLNDIQNSRQNRSKNELVRKNALTRAHESCPFWVMGSCFQCKKDEDGKMNEKKWKTKIPSHVCVDHKAHGLKSWFPPEFFQIVFFLFNFFSPFWIMDHLRTGPYSFLPSPHPHS